MFCSGWRVAIALRLCICRWRDVIINTVACNLAYVAEGSEFPGDRKNIFFPKQDIDPGIDNRVCDSYADGKQF